MRALLVRERARRHCLFSLTLTQLISGFLLLARVLALMASTLTLTLTLCRPDSMSRSVDFHCLLVF